MAKVKTEDMNYYGEGVVLTTEEAEKKPNTNVLIAGTTGEGKSFSAVMPRLLYTCSGKMVGAVENNNFYKKFQKKSKNHSCYYHR